MQPYGVTLETGPVGGEVPITGVLGDQHAAMVGQVCLAAGEAKNTYGTGNFLLLNTGETIVRSDNGLLTTVCYQFGDAKPVYALEGSIAVTGSAVQWLRDQLGIISGAAQSESLARQVADNGGVYFVPAFSGLFAPYWRSDARGAIVGLSRFNTNAHLARATLEAICYQSRDVVDAMEADSGVRLEVLKVDGGITGNDLCMQIQADVLGVDVVRPVVAETTALGAAYAAGLAVGFWADPSDLRANWQEDKRWTPTWSDDQRAAGYAGWRKAVQRTLDWVDVSVRVPRAVCTASAGTASRGERSVLAEDAVDLAARIVDDLDDALLLLGGGGVRGLRDRAEQLADGRPQVDVARVGAFGDLVPRWGLDLLGRRATLVGQLEKLLAAVGFPCGDQALVVQQLQRRVHRPGAGLPDPVAALGDLLDHFVAVHRPLGQQRQDGRSHVAATSAAGRRHDAIRRAGRPARTRIPGRSPDRNRGRSPDRNRGRSGRRRGRGGVRGIPVGPGAWLRAGRAVVRGRGRSRIRNRAGRRMVRSGGVNGVLMVGSPLNGSQGLQLAHR